MTDVASLEMRPDGSVIMDCQLPCGRNQRYSFTDTRALVTFIRGMHYQASINLEVLSQAGPVPRDLIPRTQLMLAIIKRCTEFIDFYQPQNTWGKELTAGVLAALTRGLTVGELNRDAIDRGTVPASGLMAAISMLSEYPAGVVLPAAKFNELRQVMETCAADDCRHCAHKAPCRAAFDELSGRAK